MSSLEQKLAQFNAFYLISHPIRANIIPLSETELKADKNTFEANMPYAFKIATEMSQIQSQSLKPLRSLGDKLEELVDYLQLQAKKIDLMMSYVLEQQDNPEYRFIASKFGGGGIVFEQENSVEIGDRKALKLFLESESAAIYCYAEAISCECKDDKYEVSYIYTHIREQDQELLVRASLHLQTQLLRAKNENHE